MTQKHIAVLLMLLVIAACQAPVEDLKSPCVGTDDSPCVKRPVNDWWQRS